jgi:hypothetical protein
MTSPYTELTECIKSIYVAGSVLRVVNDINNSKLKMNGPSILYYDFLNPIIIRMILIVNTLIQKLMPGTLPNSPILLHVRGLSEVG